MLKIAIIAGEPSGDMLAARLMHELKSQAKQAVEFIGIGGDMMKGEGFVSSYNMEILSVGGYGFDVIKAIPKILSIRLKIIQQIIDFKPNVFIGVDAPDFNFYVEKKLKQNGIKTVHYVSPTIWAWRYNRIFKIKKTTDLMLCIFPMEEPLYARENIPAKFIGHHLADQIEMDIDTLYYKNKLNLTGTVFCVLFGSRKSEINSLGKIFIEACSLINKAIPGAVFLYPMVNQSMHDLLLQILNDAKVDFKYQLLINQTADAIKASDMVLAKSGTVTLEVALCKKPLIISYKVSKFTEWLLRRRLYIKFVGQPNILLNEEVAPELLQDDANPENLAHHFVSLYNDKTRQNYMITKFYGLHHTLAKNASALGASSILNLIKK
jgi:lipid-A-disaccharide synthase